jgi:hypothetical protein
MIAGVTYRRIDDAGLHITVDGQEQVPVDNVIICAGQEPNRALQQGLLDAGKTVHLIGGADVAAELDAKRAINQGASGSGDLSEPKHGLKLTNKTPRCANAYRAFVLHHLRFESQDDAQ